MASKVCPVCGKRSPAEATTCGCGNAFTTEIVRAPVTPDGYLFCPSCGRSCRRTAKACNCGHGFDEDPEVVQHMLAYAQTTGWLSVVGGCLSITATLLIPLSIKLVVLCWVGGTALAVKGVANITRARRGRRVYKLPGKPPIARLLKR